MQAARRNRNRNRDQYYNNISDKSQQVEYRIHSQ